MPTVSELTSVYTADISDLKAKHAKAMQMVEEFKRGSGGSSNPFAMEGADKAGGSARNSAASLRRSTDGRAGVADSFIENLADHVNTPAGKASCGYFAEAILKATGARFVAKGYGGGAEDLIQRVIAQGGYEVSAKEARPGDLVYFHGTQYGAIDPKTGRRSEYHVGINEGGGFMAASSGGKTRDHEKLLPDPHFVRPYRTGTLDNGEKALQHQAETWKAAEKFARRLTAANDELDKKLNNPDRFSYMLPGMMKDEAARTVFDKPYRKITDPEHRKEIDDLSRKMEAAHNRRFKDKMAEEEMRQAQERLKKEDEAHKAEIEAADQATKAAEEVAKKWQNAIEKADEALAKANGKDSSANARTTYVREHVDEDTKDLPMGGYGGLAMRASLASKWGQTYDKNEQDRMDKNYADSLKQLTDQLQQFGRASDEERLKAIEVRDGVQQMTEADARRILAMQKYVEAMKQWNQEIDQLSADATKSVMSILEKVEVSGSHGLGKTLIQTGNKFAREEGNRFLSKELDSGFRNLFGGAGSSPDGSALNPLWVQFASGLGGSFSELGNVIPGLGSVGAGGAGGMGGVVAAAAGLLGGSGGSGGGLLNLAAAPGGAILPSAQTNITNHYHGVGNLNSKTASQIAAAQQKKAKMATGHA